ncbi:hypothetical protein AVEN_235885-1 [Araneus ventricosus]|uniref:Uncharacterized protein n=1 Tax=Araneus ventricosus TaxID=182803 RepID=A0A4Y2N1K4_ARAVE|nr:hypothetical protein AVEN_235885-1 [Araneus ventricosus]
MQDTVENRIHQQRGTFNSEAIQSFILAGIDISMSMALMDGLIDCLSIRGFLNVIIQKRNELGTQVELPLPCLGIRGQLKNVHHDKSDAEVGVLIAITGRCPTPPERGTSGSRSGGNSTPHRYYTSRRSESPLIHVFVGPARVEAVQRVTEEDILSEITNEMENDDDDTDPSQSLLTSQEALQSV